METWSKYGFKNNPFSLMPGQAPGKLIWAGLGKTKMKFDETIKEALTSEASKLVLIASRWGGGKTHAANFFSNPDNLPTIDGQAVPPPINCVIVTPKEGADAAYEFYKKVLETIGIEKIAEAVKSMRSKLSEPKTIEMLSEWTGSRDIGRILLLLGDDDSDAAFSAGELFFNKPTAAIRKKLKIRRGIEDTTDRFRILSATFKILSEYNETGSLEKKRKVILWIDEVESLILYTSKQYVPFSQALRELIDMSKKDLIVFMNFSFTDLDDLRTLEFIIGSALKDRINARIIFGELETEEAKEYAKIVMKNTREDGFDKGEFFPFSEESLTQLFEKGVEKTKLPLTPRLINRWCEAAINKAASALKNEIDSSFVFNLKFVGDEII
jgi:hypothetical protein